MDGSIGNFQFTNNWFSATALKNWQSLMPQVKPQKVLEIGSYEGASASYLIGTNIWHDEMQLFCVDTWEGGVEHQEAAVDMATVEERFNHNIAYAQSLASKTSTVTKLKGTSDIALAQLLADGHGSSFDFIYVDGSHQAPDVMLDALLAFKLCKVGGYIAFDDYLWSEDLPQGRDPIRCPKMAIDAFTNIYFRKVQLLSAPLGQVYVTKTSE